MEKNNFFIIFLVFTLFLSGCVSSYKIGNKNIKDLSSAEKKAQQSPDKEAIVKVFGIPSSIYQKEGKEVYEYRYTKVYSNILMAVPFAGIFAPQNIYYDNYLYVYFDESGKVSSYEKTSTGGAFPPKKKQLF